MLRALIIPLLLAGFSAGKALASPLIADVSTYMIQIDTGFTGTRVLLFGARNEGGDVVVVVRGPEKNVTVRKKGRMGGIWVNKETVRFSELPYFYAVASSRPLEEIRSAQLFRWLGVGMPHVLEHTHYRTRQSLEVEEFRQAFLEHQRLRRLYSPGAQLQFMGETLFKTIIDFPDTIAAGDYTAEVYLFSGNELTAMQSVPIQVSKTGFDAAVYNLAHEHPVYYGVLAVMLALLAGWVASRIFGKI